MLGIIFSPLQQEENLLEVVQGKLTMLPHNTHYQAVREINGLNSLKEEGIGSD